MEDNNIQIGEVQEKWSASGRQFLKYTIEMYHNGLNEHKMISAPDIDILQHKVDLQYQRWYNKWQTLVFKNLNAQQKEQNIEEAERKSAEAKEAIQEIDNLLIHTLSIDDKVDWERLKLHDEFAEKIPPKPTPENPKEYPSKPVEEYQEFKFIEKLFKSKKRKKMQQYENNYAKALANWEKEKLEIESQNNLAEKKYKDKLSQWEKKKNEWEKRKAEFVQKQEKGNAKIDDLKNAYLKGDTDALIEQCDMVLNNSEYPDSFSNEFELEYNPENKILIVEYQLPEIDSLPKIKEVRYIASRNELKEYPIPQTQIQKMFDEAMYKITLRTIHELFEADVINAIKAISFNGWIRATNKASGKEEENCIMSIQVQKDEFLEINLSQIDPKSCFKMLKGVASSKLSTITPIQPILQIDKSDRRFVNSHEVVNNMDESENLAAMDWEDFEHLIRELFEKEFQANGGEVKVTQASRDGGVDAIAFDPDPIRGGKIVIQAKRYTNTVGVSAVRDLYGTVLNEGATKGILVSTADYGPDAYGFAKGKPLTLLNGSNLLHLLGKHGYHAKINLKEAKKILSEKKM